MWVFFMIIIPLSLGVAGGSIANIYDISMWIVMPIVMILSGLSGAYGGSLM